MPGMSCNVGGSGTKFIDNILGDAIILFICYNFVTLLFASVVDKYISG